MAKNILIFSDGTGQRGGLQFDELRSNIYKLYRATRCGPDTIIDPSAQLTFYDPGLGTDPTGNTPVIRLWRRFYNMVSGATGLGITRNIINCYAAIIRMWQPGDRIYLFGFSRSAYTVRCVAAVLALCGVPTRDKDGSLRRDESSTGKIAREAVTRVYQHVGSPRETKYLPQRQALAALFRQDYAAEGTGRPSNAYPCFMGVFETGAALANKGALLLVTVWTLALLAAASALLNLFLPYSFWLWFGALFAVTAAGLAVLYVYTHLKFSFRLKEFSFWQTLHLNALRHEFYDQSLNPNVNYTKHALSLDERRADALNDGAPFRLERRGQRRGRFRKCLAKR